MSTVVTVILQLEKHEISIRNLEFCQTETGIIVKIADKRVVTMTDLFPNLKAGTTTSSRFTYIGVTRGAVFAAITRREAILIGMKRSVAEARYVQDVHLLVGKRRHAPVG